jgi:two-component system sensor histidine kinase/response regulator
VNEEIKARLLIVDDEVAQMRALCETLSLEGFATRGYSSAREALDALKPDEFDLLLTDLMMPEMDGITLGGAALKVDPAMGLILMTGHGTIDTAVKAMQQGAMDYILKPFKLNTILPVIARSLNVQRLRREVAALEELERRRSEELAAANRDLEAYSYSISHDLRAPLRVIDGYAQMLLEDFADPLGAEGARLINVIRGGSQRMDQLIVGLLEFSRAGKQTLDVTLVDMTMLADLSAAEVMALYVGPVPRIEMADLPSVPADPSVIRQVWCNLIGNALKYSAKRDQPLIRIGGWIENDEAVYEVKDNGAGFDMRFADKLFGVFQRLHQAEEFSGTGVGLAITHRIITRHGGRIWAESTPGNGACFRFALPIRLPGRGQETGTGSR